MADDTGAIRLIKTGRDMRAGRNYTPKPAF